MKAFLSYASDDMKYADELKHELRKLGVNVFDWRDTAVPLAGFDVQVSIRKALDDTDALIQIVPRTGTPHANGVWFEAGAAKALEKSVFAVMPDSQGRESASSVADFAVFDASKKPVEDVAMTLFRAFRPVAHVARHNLV